ncbi:MAG: 16S rRNA U1498 N3-methylase RsmE [Thermodesulfobacterium sp.]|uniref:Ribosomal RNA small subunit methyltransferase E n=1 Tax=Candidatus Thermodesulfobacterium syntrophicum TaxID=3060442 RepID=A0AAE3P164_9BACT|nr:16S rRNA U1498 N3-methylase RsmE [Candidatus Thermodesulfobacterium syntrophicum]
MHIQGGNRFFFAFEEETGFLSEEESHHLIKVLRKKTGEKIKLINGKGKEYEGEILEIAKKGKSLKVKVKLLKLLREEKFPSKKIVALIPVLKGDKTEFLVEKGTELGISVFIPFQSDYSAVKYSSRLKERLKKKAINALKQSGRLYLPEIKPPVNLKEFLAQDTFPSSFKIIALPEEGVSLKNLLKGIFNSEEIVLISGPEGGFSEEEKKLLKEKSFLSFNLSPYILRAETASLSLMSFISILIRLEKR